MEHVSRWSHGYTFNNSDAEHFISSNVTVGDGHSSFDSRESAIMVALMLFAIILAPLLCSAIQRHFTPRLPEGFEASDGNTVTVEQDRKDNGEDISQRSIPYCSDNNDMVDTNTKRDSNYHGQTTPPQNRETPQHQAV